MPVAAANPPPLLEFAHGRPDSGHPHVPQRRRRRRRFDVPDLSNIDLR
jgi:hypothetical protein